MKENKYDFSITKREAMLKSYLFYLMLSNPHSK